MNPESKSVITNPKYNAVIIIVLLVLVFIIGFFIYKNIGSRQNPNLGQVGGPQNAQIREHLELLGAKGEPILGNNKSVLVLGPNYQTDATAQVIRDNLTYADQVLTAGRALDSKDYPYIMFPVDNNPQVKNSVLYVTMKNIGGGLTDVASRTAVTNWMISVANSWKPNPLILYDVDYAWLKMGWGDVGDESPSNVADTIAPVISNITVAPTKNSATFTWYADEESSSLVEYGTTPSYGTTTPEGKLVRPGLVHTVTIKTPLLPNTTYYYLVESRDQHGNLGKSAGGVFKTLAQ